MAGSTKLMTTSGGGVNLTPASNIASDVTVQIPSVAGTLVSTGSTGQITLGMLPVGALPSMVRLNTANGYGSTNTKIRRFTNVVTNQGSDITYADSATLGASFTININGVYAVSYSDDFSAVDSVFITLNDTVPTAVPNISESLAASTCGAAGWCACASWTGFLIAGSVIRARSYAGTSTGTTTQEQQFTITRVA